MDKKRLLISRENKTNKLENSINSSSNIFEDIKDFQKLKVLSDNPIISFEMLKKSIKDNNFELSDKMLFYEDNSCLIEIKDEDDFFNILEYHKKKKNKNNLENINDDFNIVLKSTNRFNNKLNETISNGFLTSYSLSSSKEKSQKNKNIKKNINFYEKQSSNSYLFDKTDDNFIVLKNMMEEFKINFYLSQDKILELIDKKIENKFQEMISKNSPCFASSEKIVKLEEAKRYHKTSFEIIGEKNYDKEQKIQSNAINENESSSKGLLNLGVCLSSDFNLSSLISKEKSEINNKTIWDNNKGENSRIKISSSHSKEKKNSSKIKYKNFEENFEKIKSEIKDAKINLIRVEKNKKDEENNIVEQNEIELEENKNKNEIKNNKMSNNQHKLSEYMEVKTKKNKNAKSENFETIQDLKINDDNLYSSSIITRSKFKEMRKNCKNNEIIAENENLPNVSQLKSKNLTAKNLNNYENIISYDQPKIDFYNNDNFGTVGNYKFRPNLIEHLEKKYCISQENKDKIVKKSVDKNQNKKKIIENKNNDDENLENYDKFNLLNKLEKEEKDEVIIYEYCNFCNAPKNEIKFFCLICDNFFLCDSCQRKDYHNQHPLITKTIPFACFNKENLLIFSLLNCNSLNKNIKVNNKFKKIKEYRKKILNDENEEIDNFDNFKKLLKNKNSINIKVTIVGSTDNKSGDEEHFIRKNKGENFKIMINIANESDYVIWQNDILITSRNCGLVDFETKYNSNIIKKKENFDMEFNVKSPSVSGNHFFDVIFIHQRRKLNYTVPSFNLEIF